MEEMFKQFSVNFHRKLKNTVNGGVKCTVDEKEDKLYIEIERLGVQYKTSVDKISEIIASGETDIEITFDKVVKRYRSFINHKFFY